MTPLCRAASPRARSHRDYITAMNLTPLFACFAAAALIFRAPSPLRSLHQRCDLPAIAAFSARIAAMFPVAPMSGGDLIALMLPSTREGYIMMMRAAARRLRNLRHEVVSPC